MEIYGEVADSKSLCHGCTTFSVTAKPVCLSFPVAKGLLVRTPGPADPGGGNTACIWIGGPRVTADTSATGGMCLPPGSALVLPCSDPSLIYAISTTGGQILSWMGV
jgi:hypothetical protein